MSSFFSITKKTLLLGLGLLLLSSSTTEAKPNSNLRRLQQWPYRCWLEIYGRGYGTSPSDCPPGQENDNGLCYTPCKTGYTGSLNLCWQECPAGWGDTGLDCSKPPGQDCPAGMTDFGLLCQKNSYDRGVGKAPGCPDGYDVNEGLCYANCNPGYKEDGTKCWGSCPDGLYQCNALCVESIDACYGDLQAQAQKVTDSEIYLSTGTLPLSEINQIVGSDYSGYAYCTNM